jgi:hypothetical protein
LKLALSKQVLLCSNNEHMPDTLIHHRRLFR